MGLLNYLIGDRMKVEIDIKTVLILIAQASKIDHGIIAADNTSIEFFWTLGDDIANRFCADIDRITGIKALAQNNPEGGTIVTIA